MSNNSTFPRMAATLGAGLMLLAGSALAVGLEVKEGSSYVAPDSVPGATTVDTARAHELWKARAWFVDPRSDSDWQAGRIPGHEYRGMLAVASRVRVGLTHH